MVAVGSTWSPRPLHHHLQEPPRPSPATEMETASSTKSPASLSRKEHEAQRGWGCGQERARQAGCAGDLVCPPRRPPPRLRFLVCNGKDNLGGLWVGHLGWLCTHVSGSCCCDRSLGCGKVGFKRPAGKDHLSLDFSWGNQQGPFPGCQVASSLPLT